MNDENRMTKEALNPNVEVRMSGAGRRGIE